MWTVVREGLAPFRVAGVSPTEGLTITATPASGLKILLIEDDAMVREVVTEMLGSLGHSVLAAAGGRQGLARLEAGEAADLVLTDLNMPEMSGWDVIKAVKARWPHLPVGVITGTPEALLEQRWKPLACVILKPVSLYVLQKAISQVRPHS